MGTECSTHGEKRNVYIEYWWLKPRRKEHTKKT
jgi:hypothetical protein